MSFSLNYEFVYNLDLPLLPDIITKSFANELQKHYFLKTKFITKKIADEIKPEFLNICGINFSTMVIFYKNNLTGRIHRDTDDPHKSVWGINWIHGGTCIMEYWTKESIGCEGIPITDSQGNKIEKYNSTIAKPALKTYLMPPKAYLVNASYLHRATAIGRRHAIVLRPTDYTINWKDALEIFKPLITGIPELYDKPFLFYPFIE